VGELDRRVLLIDPETDEVEDEDRDAIARATDDAVQFVRNFFIQFFFEGYDFEIDGFNEETLDDLEDYFRNRRGARRRPPQDLPRPDTMISAFERYLDLDDEVIEGEYSEDPVSLRALYCSFLPSLFTAFERNGRAPVTNYVIILSRITVARRKLQQKCP
jgi:hypothetical protein